MVAAQVLVVICAARPPTGTDVDVEVPERSRIGMLYETLRPTDGGLQRKGGE